MPTAVLFYSFIFVIGLAVGGFVNACVDRFSKKESSFQKAKCEGCGKELPWTDRIPLIGFLLRKGRCRTCGHKISVQYPLVELANGVLYIIVFMANGFNLRSALYCLMTSAFLVISIVDERTFEIPFPCNVFLGGLGVVMCVYDHQNILQYIIGFCAISGALYLLYVLSKGGAIGGGDVKLMAAAGLILGWKLVTLAFFAGCIVGAFCHVIRMKVSKAERVLAMGPYLCTGLWICALWGNQFINWYLSFLIP